MKSAKQPLPGASLFWVVAVVLLAVLAASLGNAWHAYDEALEHEFRLLEVRANQREASIVGALESVNLMLGNVIADVSEQPALTTSSKNRLLKEALRQLPQLRSLLLTDSAGTVVASANEQLIGFDASAREYFTVHRDAPLDHTFHISAPFKTVTGLLVTTQSRSIVDRDGRFRGVAVATFDGDYFNKALEFRILSPGTQAALVHQSGTILSSVPNTQLVGQNVAGGPAFSVHRAGTEASSRHVTVTKLAQVKRLVVVHSIGAAPMVVILSSDFDAAIAEWRQSMLIYTAGFLSLVTITLVATALAWRRQRALVEREHFIKHVTDAMPGMVGYWDRDLRCQFANKTYLEWFGKPPEVIIGDTALSLFGETLFEKNAPLMRETLKGKAQHFERTLTKADGRVGYTWAHYIPDVRESGEVVGFFVLVTDITPLKLAELKLRDSEAFARGVLDSLTEHVAVIDANGVITSVNTAWQQFAADNGAAEMAKVSIGANYLEICASAARAPNGEEGAQVLAGIRGVLDGSLPEFTLEYPCHSPHAQRWFILRSLPMRGANPGAVLIHQNVTSQHEAEVLLRASEEHFRLLAENMADMVWKADNQMRFTYVNGADRLMRGFERDEVIGTTIADALTPHGQTLLAELVRQRRAVESSGQKGVVLSCEIPMRHKLGGEVWIELSTMPTYDNQGRIESFQGMGRDISDRKRRESYEVESHQQLESHLHDVEEEKSRWQEQAVRDPLTGVFNRRYLDETLPRELARAQREGYPVAVVMLDLDHFKNVNDQYGHAAGDEVLRALGALLKNGARASDMVCRYGGEEFVVVLPNMSLQMTAQRIDGWRKELEALHTHYGNFSIRVTLSAGIAGYPENGDSADILLTRADEMLYHSKREGRNRISVYGAGQTDTVGSSP